MLKRSQIIIIVAIVAIVAGALAYVTSISNKPKASDILSAVPGWAMRVGSPNASVTIIEFYDPLCPYCAVVHYRLGGELHRLVEEGHLRLFLVPLPVHGNESLVLVNALYCAYRRAGGEALSLLNEWYVAFVEYAVNKTESRLKAVLERLNSYMCNETLTFSQISYALYGFKSAGIEVRGTPTFIVVKDSQVTVIEGAKVEELKSILT